jgi:DNA-binding CsgD family transcriptional regulator
VESDRSLAPVIELIYEAMLDPAQWPRALAAVAQAVDGRLPMLHHHDTRAHAGRFLLHAGYDPATVQSYRDYYSARNVWLSTGARLLGSRTVRSSHMMCSRRELLRSEWYCDFLQPLGISQAVGGTLISHDEGAFSCITILRGPQSGDFSERELRILESLVPHLRRALQVHARLMESVTRERLWLEALEKAAVGVLLVTATWKVLYANPAARTILDTAGGLVLDRRGIRASNRDYTARLQALIGRAAQTAARRALHAGGVLRLPRPNGHMPLEVTISPLSPNDVPPLGESAVAALYLQESGRRAGSVAAALACEYGLTPGETRVFEVLASGISGKQAAEKLGISYNTLKTHLQRLFMKTGTRKQVELIHLAHGGGRPIRAATGRRGDQRS